MSKEKKISTNYSGDLSLMSILGKISQKPRQNKEMLIKDVFGGLMPIKQPERKIIMSKPKTKKNDIEIIITYIPAISSSFEISAFCGPSILHMSIVEFREFMEILKSIEDSKPTDSVLNKKYNKMLKWEVVSDNNLEKFIMYNKHVKDPVSLSQYNMASQVSQVERTVYNYDKAKNIPLICG